MIPASSLHAQDRVVLRVGTEHKSAKISFDADGVRLADGQTFGWDEINAGSVTTQQGAFDKMLKELGEPLFRIRKRLMDEDYPDIATHAEAVLPVYQKRRSLTAYMVFQGLVWSRLKTNQPELALEPYFLCLECEKKLAEGLQRRKLPGPRSPQNDYRTGLSKEFAPIWFDPAAAKAAWPRVKQAVAGLEKPVPPGVFIYAGSLALAAGETAAADELLKQTPRDLAAVRELLLVVDAQREVQAKKPGPAVEALAAQVDRLTEPARPLAYYWLGLTELASSDAQKQKLGTLHMLILPALYSENYKELAAAGLYHARRALEAQKDPRSGDLGDELLRSFAGTFHELKRRNEIGPQKKDSP